MTDYMQENTELATIPVSEAIAEFGANGGVFKRAAEDLMTKGYFASFNTDGMEERKRLLAATSGDVKLLRDFMEVTLQVADIVFEQTEVTDDDGFASRTIGVIIIDVDGNAYKSTSSGVVKSVGKMLDMLGMPDSWGDTPVFVTCKETTTARGRRYKFLDFE